MWRYGHEPGDVWRETAGRAADRTLPTAAELSSADPLLPRPETPWPISLSRRIQSRFVFHQSPPFFTFAILVLWQRLNIISRPQRTVFISNFLPVDFLSPACLSVWRKKGVPLIAVIAHLYMITNRYIMYTQQISQNVRVVGGRM